MNSVLDNVDWPLFFSTLELIVVACKAGGADVAFDLFCDECEKNAADGIVTEFCKLMGERE